MVSSVKSTRILLLFLTVAYVSEKLYLGQWLYNKNLFSESNLTAQIEPVQDKLGFDIL